MFNCNATHASRRVGTSYLSFYPLFSSMTRPSPSSKRLLQRSSDLHLSPPREPRTSYCLPPQVRAVHLPKTLCELCKYYRYLLTGFLIFPKKILFLNTDAADSSAPFRKPQISEVLNAFHHAQQARQQVPRNKTISYTLSLNSLLFVSLRLLPPQRGNNILIFPPFVETSRRSRGRLDLRPRHEAFRPLQIWLRTYTHTTYTFVER